MLSKTNVLPELANYQIPDELKRRRRGCQAGVRRIMQRKKYRPRPVLTAHNTGFSFPCRQLTRNSRRGCIQENLCPVPCVNSPQVLLRLNCSSTPACLPTIKQQVVYMEHVVLQPGRAIPTVTLLPCHLWDQIALGTLRELMTPSDTCVSVRPGIDLRSTQL